MKKALVIQILAAIVEAQLTANSEENAENSTRNDNPNSLISQLKFLKNSRSSKKALFVTSTLVFCSIWMGSLAVQVYAEPYIITCLWTIETFQSSTKAQLTANSEENAENSTRNDNPNSLISQLKFLKNSRSSKKALFVTSTLVFCSIWMGSLAVQVYAEPLFKAAVPSLPANMCAIFLAIVFLVTSVLCVLLVDRCGRKMLIIVSSLGSGLCTILLGSQLQLGWAPHWFSACLIYAYSFVYTLGAAVVPFIIMSEVFLPEVRGLCNSMVSLLQWSMGFLGLMLFELLLPLVGPGPIFYAFSVVCFSCVLFTWRMLPETKGLPVDQIQLAFLKGIK